VIVMTKILYFITDMDSMGIQLALEHKGDEIGICLLQDAVYYGCKGRRNESMINAIKKGIPIYATKRDVELRGLTKLLYREVKILDYSEIINLIFDYERIVNF